ncbi:MAG: biotin-dependent carboxyltransferase family protein [Chthoniobacterales bacterium]
MTAVLQVIDPGMGCSVQDLGRTGWKRFGVPPGGTMDRHAARWANQLVGNPEDAPVLEFLLHGADVKILSACRVAITGANAGTDVESWHATDLVAGDHIKWRGTRAGVWSYLAVSGGLDVPTFFGSASVDPRSSIGRAVRSDDTFSTARPAPDDAHTAGAWAWWEDRRVYDNPPPLKIWPGPQWDWFTDDARRQLFETEWTVSSRSDRVGYRLEGATLAAPRREMTSEPVLVGSIQIPPGGQPIVTLRDGPTVGGYPKIALVDADSLDWLTQCAPHGPSIRFTE